SPTDDYAHQGIPERMLAVEDGLEVVKAQLSENTSVIKEMSERIDLISQQLEISSPFGLKLSVDDSAEQERARIAMYKPPSREPNYVGENEIAVVAVESAGGYTGFHDYDNEILSFPRGTRLIVEDRQGEWYRVRATSGARAWVRANEVLFGSGKRGEIIGTVRVHGVDPMVR
ncbi:MAG: hypothetical protein KDD53_00475, partial [Bdellovibrionales bacterium]|nr:hypothetical protein [Bdellovibrionales bacterium]